MSDGATRRAHRWRRQTPRDPAEGSMDGTTSPRASSSPFSSPSRGVPTAADWCVPPRRPRARTLGSSEARDRIEPTNSPEPLPPLSADPVPRPTSPVRSPSFPSHAQLFNCGRVCKAWHGDAMHVLMRDTAVSAAARVGSPRAPSKSPAFRRAKTTPPRRRGARTRKAPRRMLNSTVQLETSKGSDGGPEVPRPGRADSRTRADGETTRSATASEVAGARRLARGRHRNGKGVGGGVGWATRPRRRSRAV